MHISLQLPCQYNNSSTPQTILKVISDTLCQGYATTCGLTHTSQDRPPPPPFQMAVPRCKIILFPKLHDDNQYSSYDRWTGPSPQLGTRTTTTCNSWSIQISHFLGGMKKERVQQNKSISNQEPSTLKTSLVITVHSIGGQLRLKMWGIQVAQGAVQ